LFLVAVATVPAAAEVKTVAANGFEVVSAVVTAAPPDRVYNAFGEIGKWWSSAHTFSRDAANLSLELRAGGCFCERLKNGGSVLHMVVVYAVPGVGLRLRGALGPLQTEGGRRQWAPRADRVLDEQLQRLKSFVEGKLLLRH
jgi:uncharacterized protein YndB with AHSA1/START domain